jgi:hypothetical protein
MFDPAVEAILMRQETVAGNADMRRVTRHAAELGFSLIPNTRSGYLRLALKPPEGTPVTLYLHGNRLAASSAGLRDFAASLPGAVVTPRDVRFPVVRVEIAALDSFARHAGARNLAGPSATSLSAPDARPVEMPEPPRHLSPASENVLFPAPPQAQPVIRHGRLRTGVLLGLAAAVLALVLLGNVLGGTSPDTTGESSAVSSDAAEAQIAAAERQLADNEASEAALPVDALVADPATGILADADAGQVISSAEQKSALAALATLDVKGRAPKTGYDRGLFGGGWGDTDRNGCDARNDTLARDLSGETFKPGTHDCVVLTGVLDDPYSGRSIAFQRGQTTSDDVQIDHVVAVSDAWQKGAQGWSGRQRVAFYNDPLNLLAVDGPLNMQKGDGDAATWLPPNRGYRCEYVARQIAVKVRYALWVTQAERNAMATVLAACPDQPLPMGVVAAAAPEPAPAPAPPPAPAAAPAPAPAPPPVVVPAPAPAPVPAPRPAPAPAPAPPPAASYANCDAVRAAGAAPIHPGDPGWQPKFDRDNDGVGCE